MFPPTIDSRVGGSDNPDNPDIPVGWSDADVAKVKGFLKKLEISEKDADKLIKDAKDAGDTAEGFSKYITEDVLGRYKGTEAKAALDSYIKIFKEEFKKPGNSGRLPAPGTILVTLPDNAKLTVDGSPTSSTSGERRFISPPLERGKTYSYSIAVEITLDGTSTVVTKEVLIRGGEETKVTFDPAVTRAVAQK